MKARDQDHLNAANSRRVNAYLARKRLGLGILNVTTNLARFERALRSEGRLAVTDAPTRETLAACAAELLEIYVRNEIGPEDHARTDTD
jgi:hypothetical protein